MTKPPCHDGIDDCPRRYVGCHAECEKWHEWLAIHSEEKERERQRRQAENDVLAVVARQRSRREKKEIV